MPGRIRDADVALVREQSPIDQVVREHVTLRSAGGDSLKGLCPFHDEKTPSFHVRPSQGYYHCFGCDAGGDAITFVRELEHLSFTEAVELLARRAGIELHYEQGGSSVRGQQGQRTRLVAAHAAAAQFYAEQLAGSEAALGRDFLAARGFDRAACERFGVGYAPSGWDVLTRHLRGRGFSDAELQLGGLAREGQRGLIDRFRGRLVWPIRDVAGDVIGFGARRLRDDDNGPKYLNTPETPLYRKSTVLYGIDLAKREIAKRRQAVVVEGYTDVMACHLAGVETAVASCGTAFGSEHIKVLRRLLMDQDEFRGEVVFTFDGDAAGQQAALRAFTEDQRFVTQTFVAVEPSGLDPCDLRQQRGDEAVRDLVGRRVPLFEFAIRSVLTRYDLEIPEGRVQALAAAAPVVAQIRDRALRPEYARQLAGWLGMDERRVTEAVARSVGKAPSGPTGAGARQVPQPPEQPGPAGTTALERPNPNDPRLRVEREALKIALQRPALAGPGFDELGREVFTAPAYRLVAQAVSGAGGTATSPGGAPWVTAVRESATDDRVRTLATELAVEPIRVSAGDDARYAEALLARLRELETTRRIAEVRSRLQRLDPEAAPDDYHRTFGELVTLEQQRRELRAQAVGSPA